MQVVECLCRSDFYIARNVVVVFKSNPETINSHSTVTIPVPDEFDEDLDEDEIESDIEEEVMGTDAEDIPEGEERPASFADEPEDVDISGEMETADEDMIDDDSVSDNEEY